MLGSTFIRTLLLSALLVSMVMSDCVRVSKKDLDPDKWIRENDLLWQPNKSIDAQHASYECEYSDFIRPKFISKWIWNKTHKPQIKFRTSVLHEKDAGQGDTKRTDLSISATILNNSYRWKHPFRVRYVLKKKKDKKVAYAYNFWIQSDDSCVAGGSGNDGATAVPFYAGDIDHIELYKLDN